MTTVRDMLETITDRVSNKDWIRAYGAYLEASADALLETIDDTGVIGGLKDRLMTMRRADTDWPFPGPAGEWPFDREIKQIGQ